jgi:iron complex transport system ATP-binding protein
MMIAKALAQKSDIIILDEPTAHLDLINRVEITKLLQKLAKEENKAILMATHELDLALQMADRLWLMSNGEIEEGAPEDLVISGILQKVFAKLSLDFDHLSGGFKIKTETTKSIHFESILETNEEIWTKRALHRVGYIVENNSTNPLKIKYSKSTKKWVLSDNGVEVEFSELGKLIGEL